MKEILFSVTKKDLIVQTFRSGGPGGQHQNKVNSGVRIIHKESRAVGESREYKSQYQNKSAAFKRMAEHPRFKVWHTRKVHEVLTGTSIEKKVDEAMAAHNLKIEVGV
jgi:protein subunit release factor B